MRIPNTSYQTVDSAKNSAPISVRPGILVLRHPTWVKDIRSGCRVNLVQARLPSRFTAVVFGERVVDQ
jgi:hypothetical protein